MTDEIVKVDPLSLTPGTVLRHRSGGVVVIARRKEDGSGWWNADGSGLADFVIADSGDWTVDGHRSGPMFDVADRIAQVLDIDPAKVGLNFRDMRITLALPDAARLAALAER